MFLQKLVAITTIVTISNLPSLASATEALIRTACLHPTQGEGVCEIEFPDFDDTSIWDVTWQDGTKTRIRIPDSGPIQHWNSQNDQWVDSSSVGLCFDRRCIHFPTALANSLEQQTSRITIECSDPMLDESTCQVEYVPDTDGMRVYWPDGSIEHYRTENEPYLKWSHAENGWVEVSNWGFCVDRFCLLFDSDVFN
jgi:hypothetical protein